MKFGEKFLLLWLVTRNCRSDSRLDATVHFCAHFYPCCAMLAWY